MSEYITWIAEGEPGYYRIIEYIQCLEKVVNPGDTILELGAHEPVISDYFMRNYDCNIIYSGIENHVSTSLRILFREMDLCDSEDYGFRQKWDVVTATEVLEHLPCNLYVVRDKLIDVVNPGGYLLVSAPVIGHGRGDRRLDEELPPSDDPHNIHLREFRDVDELKSLFLDLEIVDEWFSETRSVGEGSCSYNILYRKNEQ